MYFCWRQMKGKVAETAEEAKQKAQSTFETIRVQFWPLATQALLMRQSGIQRVAPYRWPH